MKVETVSEEPKLEKKSRPYFLIPGNTAGKKEVLVIGFFLTLAVVFTWPLVFHFGEAIPGDGRDGWQMVWNLWWVRYAVEHSQNPFHTGLLFYPQGADLYLHALNPLNGLISLPVQLFSGSFIPAYNVIVILSLASSAFGTYCLALYLWGSPGPALFAGVAFGFSSYHFAHLLGHLNLISAEFIPFYILFFLQTFDRDKKWKLPACLAVVALLCGILLELQYVMYLAIFSVVYILYLVSLSLKADKTKTSSKLPALIEILKRSVFIGLIFLIFSLPITIPMFQEALNNPNSIPPNQIKVYSADLLAYFYPSPFQPLWGGTLRETIRPWTATLIEKVVFPGYTVYFLSLAGLILFLTTKHDSNLKLISEKEKRKPGPVLWFVVALIFGLLSLGPRLHVNGVEYGPPLPATLIYKLPILNVTRVPSRYAEISLLSFALLAAWGLTFVQRKILQKNSQLAISAFPGVTTRERETDKISVRSKWRKLVDEHLIKMTASVVIPSLFLIVLIFELWPAPYPLAFYNVPNFYRSLAQREGSEVVLDIPMNVGPEFQYLTNYMEAQMVHRKPLMGGYISRNPVYPLFDGVPVFWEFNSFQTSFRPDILPSPKDGLALLRYFGAHFVIVHKDLVRGKKQEAVLGFAYRLFPQGPVYDAENLVVFEVPDSGVKQSVFFANLVQSGWYEPEKGSANHYSRWLQGTKSELDLWTTSTMQVQLTLPIWSFLENHPVDFIFNGVTVARKEVGLERQEVSFNFNLKPGRNRFEIAVGGRINRPSDLNLGNDSRSLSVGVGEIELKGEGTEGLNK